MTHHTKNSDQEVDFFDDDIGNKDASTVTQATENKFDAQAGEPEDTNPEQGIPELKDQEVKEAKAKVASGSDQADEWQKLAIIDDPYIAGQCTTRVTLVISPEDGHEQGPMVFIAATTHDDLPDAFLTCRFNELTLPPQIRQVCGRLHPRIRRDASRSSRNQKCH